MKCMCAQTRPRFILSSEGVLGGMEFEPMLTPREKSPLPENVSRGGSNPRRCGQRAQALPTELFRPPLSMFRKFLEPLRTSALLSCRLVLRLLHSQLYLWGSPPLVRIFAYVTVFVFFYLFIFNPTIEVVTFCFHGWCMLSFFCRYSPV